EAFWATNNAQIKPRAGGAAALRKLAEKHRVVYMTLTADQPARYNKLRAWLEHGWAPQDRFPDGPVQDMLRAFPDRDFRFKGPPWALVTADRGIAKSFQADIATFLLDKTAVPSKGITVVSSWEEVTKQLAK